ncbi:MAG: hypothetical protein QOC83_4977 [Pseudonocardiales bacterium]|nr:hypothetical protein [Pseudonocardiales bacterium]
MRGTVSLDVGQYHVVLLTPADLPSMLQRLEQTGVLAGPMGNQVRFS